MSIARPLFALIACWALSGCVLGYGPCLFLQPVKHDFVGVVHFHDYPEADGIDNVPIVTLDTTAYTYAKDPKQIFYRMKKYVDQAADYKLTRINRPSDVDPADITIKQIHLATPFQSSPEQQMQLFRAIQYGRTRGVSVVVTRIK